MTDDSRFLLVLLGKIEDWRNPVCWGRIRKLLKYSNTCFYYSGEGRDCVSEEENEAAILRAAEYVIRVL